MPENNSSDNCRLSFPKLALSEKMWPRFYCQNGLHLREEQKLDGENGFKDKHCEIRRYQIVMASHIFPVLAELAVEVLNSSNPSHKLTQAKGNMG